MKRVWTVVLVLSFLFVARSLEAVSCAKRVLVYLDVSGSMDPGGKKATSPFRQTVEALQALLQQPDFIQQGDVVEIVLFGDGTQELAGEGSPSQVAPVLESLRAGGWKRFLGEGRATAFADLSDLGAVFASLEQKLGRDDDFSRQVVIIASDFVHEPNKNGSYSNAWRSLFSQLQSSLKDRFPKDGKTRLLLFKAPPVYNPPGETGASIQNTVLSSLQPEIVPADQILAIGQPNSDPAQLAKSIREKLYNPLEVKASRSPSDENKILVIVENQNCYSLNLKQIDLECNGPNSPGDGDSVSYTSEIPANVRHLGEGGKDGAVQNVSLPLPQGSCWQEPISFVATVITQEGAKGKSKGTTGSWFNYKPIRAVVEEHIAGFSGMRKVLRLELEMKGLHVDDKSFRIKLQKGSDVIALGSFIAPNDLQIDQFKPYRLIFPISSHAASNLLEGTQLTVDIDYDSVEAEGENAVQVEEDELSSLLNLIQILISAGAFVGAAIIWVRRKKALDGFWKALDFHSLVIALGQPLIGFFPLAINYFRAYLLEEMSFNGADVLRLSSLLLVAFLAVLLPARQIRRELLEREVRSEQGIPDFETYQRRVSSGWISYTIALALVLLIGTAVILTLPKSEESRKDARKSIETIELIQS